MPSTDSAAHRIAITRQNRGAESIHSVWKDDAILGILAIHSLFHGTSRGGIRLAPDISEEEVRILAEGMTLKFGILGLPQGGAKAGLRADPDAPEDQRSRLLTEFLGALAPLLRQRTYIPGPDMGSSNEMVRRALFGNGIAVRNRELRGQRPGYFTAAARYLCRWCCSA